MNFLSSSLWATIAWNPGSRLKREMLLEALIMNQKLSQLIFVPLTIYATTQANSTEVTRY